MDMIEVPLHQSLYQMEQSIARVLWGLDRAALYMIDLIDRLRRGLVTEGFTAALDQVSTNVLGLNRSVFELALIAGLLLIMIVPIIPLKWVNLRKVIVLGLLLPIGLPLLAGSFQDIDGARADLGSTFYNSLKDTSFNMIPPDSGNGNGTTNDMGSITDFSSSSDGYEGIRGVDIAAAYLFAKREDVFNPPSSLPEDFKEKYFFADVGDFDGAMDSEERWEQIGTSSDGIMRMLFGLVLIIFSFLEAMVNLGFTLTLGFLLIGFMLSLLFAYFSIFEGMTYKIVQKVAELFLQSWSISAVQALLMAALTQAATSGNGIATLGMGILALGIQALFVSVAWKAVIGALTGFGGSGGLSGGEAGAAIGTMAGGAGAAVGAAIGSVGSSVSGSVQAAGAVASFVAPMAAGALGFLTDRGSVANAYDNAISSEMAPNSATFTPQPELDLIQNDQPRSIPRLAQLGISSDIVEAQPDDMNKLAKTLRRYPMPEDQAQGLMIDTRERGQFSPVRQAELGSFLMQDYGLSEHQASRHISVLQGRMQRVSPSMEIDEHTPTAYPIVDDQPSWLDEQPPITNYIEEK